MKLNERGLASYATCDSPADQAGFLSKKGERNPAYHRRWFVLRGNMLFYFEDRESREPVGVIVLEGSTVQLCESSEEFAFSIRFGCAKARTYVLAADSQAALEAWVKALSRASFGYLRLVVRELEKQLEEAQRSLSGAHRVQRRSPVCRKNRSAPNLEPATRGLPSPSETPTLPICVPPKENGCALWFNCQGPRSLPSGYPLAGSGPSGGNGHEGGLKPPPLPPRKRASSGNSCGAKGSEIDDLVAPVSAGFPQLHSWYGREILDLRRAWLEGRRGGGP
ncbi:sesquipedalian-1 [Paroedura picta]|uniref:sesquipedalian-1 n=1 Tax=Paroedura picta TaxID=143630 RepID=UPI004056C953